MQPQLTFEKPAVDSILCTEYAGVCYFIFYFSFYIQPWTCFLILRDEQSSIYIYTIYIYFIDFLSVALNLDTVRQTSSRNSVLVSKSKMIYGRVYKLSKSNKSLEGLDNKPALPLMRLSAVEISRPILRIKEETKTPSATFETSQLRWCDRSISRIREDLPLSWHSHIKKHYTNGDPTSSSSVYRKYNVSHGWFKQLLNVGCFMVLFPYKKKKKH